VSDGSGFATCARTYATLRVYPPATMELAHVTGQLGCEPATVQEPELVYPDAGVRRIE
jgi:hypothetical protein